MVAIMPRTNAYRESGGLDSTRFRKATVQQPHKLVDIGAADIERRRNPDDVAVYAASPDQNPVCARRFHQPHGLGGGRSLESPILNQFDGLHQSHAANIPDHWMFAHYI